MYAKLQIKLNEIVNKFLLAGDKFMPELHLTQPGFTYSACEPFTKNKEFKNLKKQELQAIFTKMNLISLLKTLYDLWRFQRFEKKNSF